MDWAKVEQPRDQLVLFPHRLDDAIGPDHRVRVLDDILTRLDWSSWEAAYDLRRGQPPIHPRVLASVILYGLLTKIRSSRALEEALLVRIDFRWLVSGRTIDHTTISEFRRKNPKALQATFVQIGLVARELGCLPLATLAFDGTRMRANNRRSGSRTPDDLRKMKKELAEKFQELEAKSSATDQSENEQFGKEAAHTVSEDLADIQRRQQKVAAALAELQRIEEAGEDEPKRLPLTDPECRIMPNKDGGYAPNYTPTATVDVDSGVIVSADVLNDINEDHMLISSVKDVQDQFGLEAPVAEVLADGLMATGKNLADCEEAGIDLYSPIKNDNIDNNRAIRNDLSQPVPAEDHDRLPTQPLSRGGVKRRQLSKSAFVYDEASNCYWCPEGKRLAYKNTTTETTKRGAERVRHRYVASPDQCEGCPLKSLCVSGQAKSRMINREQHESRRASHATKMATAEAKAKYARRAPVGERPFAVIKQHFGARQFLLRGLKQVRQEWTWMVSAFNLRILIGLIASGVGPPPVSKQ